MFPFNRFFSNYQLKQVDFILPFQELQLIQSLFGLQTFDNRFHGEHCL